MKRYFNHDQVVDYLCAHVELIAPLVDGETKDDRLKKIARELKKVGLLAPGTYWRDWNWRDVVHESIKACLEGRK